MKNRSRILLRKLPKHEQESHVNTNSISSPTDLTVNTPLLSANDYQAPVTSHSLSPTSKWLIVRNNIHKIRSWGAIKRTSVGNNSFQDWYLFFQMRRELKRTEEQIRAMQYRPDFTPVRHFDLPIDETHVRRYDVSHVQPTDGIYYGGLGSEPIVLQYLLYYFNKDCTVPYNSIFHPFLSDVSSVLDTNRQRLKRVTVFRRVALFTTLTVFFLLFLMLMSLILSVITTASNFQQMYKNDLEEEEMKWYRSDSSLPTTLIYKH